MKTAGKTDEDERARGDGKRDGKPLEPVERWLHRLKGDQVLRGRDGGRLSTDVGREGDRDLGEAREMRCQPGKERWGGSRGTNHEASRKIGAGRKLVRHRLSGGHAGEMKSDKLEGPRKREADIP